MWKCPGWITHASGRIGQGFWRQGYSNVVFGDGSSWITPETFLLPGTKRAFLLSRGDIQECSVRAEDIGKFRFCSLINAMLDPGDVVVRTEDIILR